MVMPVRALSVHRVGESSSLMMQWQHERRLWTRIRPRQDR